MIAEFNVWLLIVGLVVGAGLAWLVMLDGRRRDAEIDAVELPREAAWLSAVLAEDGYQVSPEAAEQTLLLHRAYLGAPPPDPVPDRPSAAGRAGRGRRPPARLNARPTEPASTEGQRAPSSTGWESIADPLASTRETPKVAPDTSPATAGAGPTQ